MEALEVMNGANAELLGHAPRGREVPPAVAIDYTEKPYYGRPDPTVVRGKMKDGGRHHPLPHVRDREHGGNGRGGQAHALRAPCHAAQLEGEGRGEAPGGGQLIPAREAVAPPHGQGGSSRSTSSSPCSAWGRGS
ncbi:MAG: hypothetical protein ACP5UD_06150 [Conexivisphaera sp.]